MKIRGEYLFIAWFFPCLLFKEAHYVFLEGLELFIVPVMDDLFLHYEPQPLYYVQVRAIGWQEQDLRPWVAFQKGLYHF